MKRPKTPFVHPAFTERLEDVAMSSKSPAPRVWLPSRRCKAFQPVEACFSFSRSWVSLFRAFFRSQSPMSVSRINPFLRFFIKPVGLTLTLQRFLLQRPAVLPAPRCLLATGWSPCSLELSRLSGFPLLNLEGSLSLPPSPRVLFFPPPKKQKTGTPGVTFQQLCISPFSRGARPSDVFGRQPLLSLENVNSSRPIFSVRFSPLSHKIGEQSPCNQFHPA